jgi:peptidoglycan/xylan/chitin deacetylase (PgdA/CDA1 family)
VFLTTKTYNEIIIELMILKSFDSTEVLNFLWMTEQHIKELIDQGNLIGLHSYSHPMQMSRLSRLEQLDQYTKNLTHLESLVGEGAIVSMSHPCGDYNEDTLKILTDLGIKIGFRSNLNRTDIKTNMEIPRGDQANIFKEMKK